MDFRIYIALFPTVFMFHELEEILFFKNYRKLINNKVPKMFKGNYLKKYLNLSSTTFIFTIFEEYIILVLITWITLLKISYLEFYVSLMLAYNYHILGHIIQSIIVKSYVPGLIFGIASSIVSIYWISAMPVHNWSFVLYCSVIILVLIFVNIQICFKIGKKIINRKR
ncbi:HXXEE domain-containing protein [Lactobacillus sp. ESL0785]|uniref:HXXEE domain-containing protein n=1 Tax=Lactobacillus sp. ESL0785 TaxID=2983232 RepID=UPI0023F917FE|nr:HXXEE domain-containing protein [Lactobacillus sp. ESL0785]WEV70387.1 HXXEE domain-containing protein [Lactobacillus sp. ESL0785]